MERTCIKCGVSNFDATGDMQEACPGCGVIYSRALQEQVRATAQRMPAKQLRSDDVPTRSLLGWLGLITEVLAWVGVVVGATTGAFQLSDGLEAATSAPQQAAVAAMAAAMAVVPYCLARGIQHLRRWDF